MPYILNEKPISPDVAFTAIVGEDEIQFPAGWIRLASEEEKAAIGLTWESDPEPYDQRFYWGRTEEGDLIPKDHTELAEQWIAQTKVTAGTLLAPTDWYITRMAETGNGVPQEVMDRRSQIRTLSNVKETAILGTEDTAELAAYITSSEYSSWDS